jgi:hypothetical protein
MLMELKSVEEVEELRENKSYKKHYGMIEDSKIYLLEYDEDEDNFYFKSLTSILKGKDEEKSTSFEMVDEALEFVLKRKETRDCMLYESNDIGSLLHKLLSLKKKGF